MDAHKLIRAGVANDTSKLRPTLHHALEAALSVAPSMLDELLERLADLIDPERAAPLPMELEGLDASEIVQWIVQADALKITWTHALRRVFFHGEGHSADLPQGLRFDDLMLLDDAQIDASIEFAMVENILASATADVLPRLNALMSHLMGWITVQPELNPLRPSAYARALRALLVEHLRDPQQRKWLTVPVASVLGESLHQVYKELIQWLLVHGVTPLESPSSNLAPGKALESPVGRTMLTLGRLRQLLAGDLSEVPADGQVFVQTVPASLAALEDMDLIEHLMKRLRERAPSPEPAPLAEVHPVSGQHLGQLLGQEVVRLMLESLTQDERLLPAVRAQIGLLEPSFVRLSQADPRFFSDRQHPARQLLESMAQRSLGFRREDDEGFSDFLKTVRAAVTALERVDVTEEKFARLLKRLRRRWEEDDARKHQRRADAARALLHAEQRHILAERLAGEFQQQMVDKAVPEVVQRFVCGPWAQAVAQAQLGDAVPGDEGEPLDGVVDDLIWSVQPALIRRDVDRLTRLVPRLLVQIRHNLQRIQYPAELTAQFFDALVGLHEQAFDTPVPVPAKAPEPVSNMGQAEPVDEVPEATPPSTTDTDFWMADQEAADAGFVSGQAGNLPLESAPPVVPSLDTGAWVDLKAQGEWVRAQLTWTSPRGGLFMFISASGMAHSMTRRTLERLLGADSLRVVSHGGVVDGALDAVTQHALRNSQNAQADDPIGDAQDTAY